MNNTPKFRSPPRVLDALTSHSTHPRPYPVLSDRVLRRRLNISPRQWRKHVRVCRKWAGIMRQWSGSEYGRNQMNRPLSLAEQLSQYIDRERHGEIKGAVHNGFRCVLQARFGRGR